MKLTGDTAFLISKSTVPTGPGGRERLFSVKCSHLSIQSVLGWALAAQLETPGLWGG